MIRNIKKDETFLSQKSTPCTKMDLNIARDLEDTLNAYKKVCVGMAANMIGYKKNMIIVNVGLFNLVMINPKYIKRKGKYETKEGCLSLTGQRDCIRYKEIEVEYLDTSFQKHKQSFSGFTAQIVQHEMDHLEGILI